MKDFYLFLSPQVFCLKTNEKKIRRARRVPLVSLLGFLILSQCTLQGPQKVIVLREGEVMAQQGDTVYSVAHKYGVSVKALVEANGLTPPYTLCLDQKLILPSNGKQSTPSGPSAPCPEVAPQGPQLLEGGAEVQWEEVGPGDAKEATSKDQSAHPSLIEEARKDGASMESSQSGTPASPVKPKKNTPAKPDAQKKVSFSFPVRNRKGRPKDHGICFTVEPGECVRPAASGTVLFSGRITASENPIVLVQHKDGWLTAYGPFDKISVSTNQPVTSQTALGTITPGKDLYFEMRKDRNIVNPMLYIK